MFKPATDSELEQYIQELGFWKNALKDHSPEQCDYFDLFKNELPEIVEAKLQELKPIVKETAEVLLMAEKESKKIKHWFRKLLFKIWVYDVAHQSFQKVYKEQKRFYWLEKRLDGSNFKAGMTADEFKANNPIRETIERYMPINSRGFAKCPFHLEKTNSLKVYKDHWYCFGCNEGGDVISFLMHIHNLSFQEILNGNLK